MTRLVPVPFHDDTLFGVEDAGTVHVAVTSICDALGLDAKKQRERIQRDPILSEGGATMALPSAGGLQDTFCLRLDLLPGWLFTIDHGRVREEARPRVLTYKRECFAVLCRHFYGPAAVPVSPPEVMARPQLPEAIRLRMVSEGRMVFGTRVAAELWFRLDLPVVPGMLAQPRQGVLDVASDGGSR